MGKKKQLHPYKYEIGDIYTVNNCGDNSYTIIDRRVSYNEKTQLQFKEYLCECNKCHNRSWRTEKYIVASVNNNHLAGRGCKICGNNCAKERNYKNVISKTDPWAVSLFENKADADKYTSHSHSKINFICPHCGRKKHMEIREVIKNKKVSCPWCGDGYSYPNKFAYALFSRLPVQDLAREYHAEWSKLYRYDISFKYHGVHYLVEMDGDFHYESKGFDKNLEDQMRKDQEKDYLAKSNGCVLIRIDSRESNCDYLKDRFLESPLNDIFDFSSVSWKDIENDCLTSVVVGVANYYKTESKDLKVIGKHFGLNSETIRRYLKKCTGLGLIDYKTEIELKNENIIKVAEMRNDNPKITFREMSCILGKEDTTVRNYYEEALKRGLIKERLTVREIRSKEIDDIIINNPNKSKTELCKLANCCLQTLNDHIARINRCA